VPSDRLPPTTPSRPISVQLALWHGHARGAIVPILVVGLLRLDVCIHRLGDGLVSTLGRVLVRDLVRELISISGRRAPEELVDLAKRCAAMP